MNTKIQNLFTRLNGASCAAWVALVVLTDINQAAAQLPVITTFSQNGLLVCSNLAAGTVASVQWASSLSGPWHTNWAGLDTVAVESNGMIHVSVPMFYRVLGVAQTNSAASNMVLIPAGSFTMGDTLDGESDAIPISVTVSAFYMDVNLVSYCQWQSLYYLATNAGYDFDNAGSGKSANQPVQTVDWYDTLKWCNARSQQVGLTPVYYTDTNFTQVYMNGDVDAVCANWTASGYRLPTEAEWEKAARGGLSGQRFPWGNVITENLANYLGDPTDYSYDFGPNGNNSIGILGGTPYTSPVGSFAPNGYGLYDMAGNVWEWCWDWYGTPYAGGTDPRGPATGNYRDLRGGSWAYNASLTRCANRSYSETVQVQSYFGFRCVRGL